MPEVHGIGPFSTDFVDPTYELSDSGIALVATDTLSPVRGASQFV